MAARADVLGDVGESAPEHWEGPFGRRQVHVLVMISAQDPAALAAREQRCCATAIERHGGITVVGAAGRLRAARRRRALRLRRRLRPARRSRAAASTRCRARARRSRTAAGGRSAPASSSSATPTRRTRSPAAPAPDQLAANGSYLVYRKLRQDVAAFRRTLADAARHYPGGEELLAAKLVGRWRDGTPLDVSPDRPDPAVAADPARNNAFSYLDDQDGLRCPAGSHIRRANPRHGLPFEGKLVNRHRLIRRGIPYGDPLPPGAEDDGQDRGVVFMCLQASITRQFEFVQAQWFNDGNGLHLGDDEDVLMGRHDGAAAAQDDNPSANPPCFVGPLSRVVTVRGGEYFFTPGINGLQHLAALD